MSFHNVSGFFCPDDGIENAEQGELAAASSLAMCMAYATKPGPEQPLTALPLLLAMQVCVALSYRLQVRKVSRDDSLHRHAVRMTERSSESVIRIKKTW